MKTIKPGVWIAKEDVKRLGGVKYNLFRKRLKESGYQISPNAGLYSYCYPTDTGIVLTYSGDLVWFNRDSEKPRVSDKYRLTVEEVLNYVSNSNTSNRKLSETYVVVAGDLCETIAIGSTESYMGKIIDKLEKETGETAKVYSLTTNKLVTVTSTHKFTLL